MIDDLRLRIEEGEAGVRREVAAVKDMAINKFDEADEKIFKVDSRITANEILKHQFEVFKQKQEDIDNQWIGYKDEVKAEFKKTNEHFTK